jgi:hypothetical protein
MSLEIVRRTGALLCAGILLVLPELARAQDAMDIFVAEVTVTDGRLEIGQPRNVTQRAGYDNQPWFLPDGRSFLYTSERDGQTDIFRHDLLTGGTVRITNTPENEYSPSLPLGGERMMVVRWPTDMSTGALWWFTPEGEPLEQAVGSVERVGYYAFVDEHMLALFINDSVQSFILSDTRTGDTIRVGQELGSSAPRTIPGEKAVSFLHRHEDGVWWLSRLNVADRSAVPLVRMLGGVPNYTWTPQGTVLAADDGKIMEWVPGTAVWRTVVAYTDPALQGITRIAISPQGDRIAFVSARPPEEVR